MATKKPLVLNGGQIQQLQSGDYVSTTSLFDPATNLGSASGLATNGITIHNGTAFSTVSLTQPASGMTITNADGTSGSPTFAFTAELSQLLGLGTGIVAKTGAGTLAARTIQGTTDQITLTNGTGVSGNPTIAIASNPILPGTGSVTVPSGTTGEKPAGSAGMIRYNTTSGLFEFYQSGGWINYGTSSATGTVTSVALSLPSFITVSGSPITTSGTLTGTLASQSANTVFVAPNGSAGAPTFRVLAAADIPSLPWSKITSGTPTTLSGYGITDGVVNTTTVSAGTGLSGGGALSSNVTISMPNVGTSVSAQFVKITTDAQGRVSATTSVGSSDITTALGYTPVSKAGDSMSSAANLTFSGGGVPTGLPAVAISSTDAVSKAYVDSLVAASATWRNPIVDINLLDVVTAIPGAPTDGGTYIKYGGTQGSSWGSVTSVVDNDVLSYTTVGGWTRIDTLNAGDRFIIAGEAGTVGGTLSGVGFVNDDLVQYVSGSPALFASWTTPEGRGAGPGTEIAQGITVLVNDPDSYSFGHTYLYDAANNLWVEIAGPGTVGAGTGLSYSGSVLNVNLGAGIKELPTDEVGIDLYDAATGALILTSDGSTRITTTGGQLYLKLDSTTLTQGANGLKVASGGITGTELNASVAGNGLAGGGGSALSVNVDGSTLEITTDTLNVKASGITATQLATSVAGNGLAGGGGTALSVNVDNSSIEINTDSLRVKAAGVTNTMLANSAISLAGESGTGTVSLGGTLTITAGTGIDTVVSGSTATVSLNANLADITDVTITSAAAGHVLYRNGGNTAWINGAPGATSGVQGYDATLAALAALNTTAGVVVQTGTDTFTKRTITGTARVIVTNGDGVSGNPTLDLATGVVTAGTYSSVTVDTYGRVTAGSATEASTQVAMTNANAGSIVIGTPVYVSASGSVNKAQTNAGATSSSIGLVADTTIATTATGNITVAGVLTATTGQWDAVTGQTGGLTAGTRYFVSAATAGALTTTATTTTGEYVAPIGIALSTTKMKVDIDPTIQL